MRHSASVLLPSYRRPGYLVSALSSLARQTVPPDEVIVIWQGDDLPTRDTAERQREQLAGVLGVRVVHSPETGVVPAENAGLAVARGEIVLLLDDDALAPADWVARHLAHYADPTVGAVGGPVDNVHPDGTPFPRRSFEPIGKVPAAGRLIGNLYDQDVSWRARPPIEVDALIGSNLSLRRVAFDRFEPALKPYWSLFETDACFQVKARGYRVRFDFGIVVEHHPTNTAYIAGREGDLTIKVENSSYNHAFVLSRWSSGWRRPLRWLGLFLVGSVNTPGLVGALVAVRRFGRPGREWGLLRRSWRAKRAGWRDGRAAGGGGGRPDVA
jgi:GT2 family glycosyltransferase